MIHLRATADEIYLRFDSDITFVDHAVEILRTLMCHQGEADPTPVLLASRELLKNAVVHGNRNDPTKEVRHRVTSLGDGSYRVETEDEGQGFPHDGLRDRPGGGRGQPSSRGFAIIESVAAELLFSDRGNVVIAYVGARG